MHSRGLALMGGLLDHHISSHGLHSHGLHSNSVEVLFGVIGKKIWAGSAFLGRSMGVCWCDRCWGRATLCLLE